MSEKRARFQRSRGECPAPARPSIRFRDAQVQANRGTMMRALEQALNLWVRVDWCFRSNFFSHVPTEAE